MNCPHCGAVIKEGKFCNYCGAKLPDDTKRVEVKIDKRIEDVAEVKRAEYEEKESALRQKQMKRDLKTGNAKIVFLLIGILCFVLFILSSAKGWPLIVTGLSALASIVGFSIFYVFMKK